MPQINVVIDKNGVKMDAEGFVGEACRAKTGPYAQRLGGPVEEDAKAELYETEQMREGLTS